MVRNLRFSSLLILISTLFSILVSSETLRKEAKVAIFDLVEVNATAQPHHGKVYGVELFVGEPGQRITVFPSFYLPDLGDNLDIGSPGAQPELYIPSKSVCLINSIDPSEWNTILEPRPADFISTARQEGPSAGMTLVRWKPSASVKKVNLMLRKGAGNVTSIEKGITNDGDYPWNATHTFVTAGLKPGDDYSLMIWTDDPPKQSYSGKFYMGEEEPDDRTAKPPQGENLITDCLNYLAEHGGYYNESADYQFEPEDLSMPGEYSTKNVSWAVNVEGLGRTKLTWQPFYMQRHEDEDANRLFNLTDVPFAKITRVNEGIGAVGLSHLQMRRNLGIEKPLTNVVGLYLGSDGIPGSVVMGGYDKALINHERCVTYSRKNRNMFIELQSIKVNKNSAAKETDDEEKEDNEDEENLRKREVYEIPYSRQGVLLSYQLGGMRLPTSTIADLLPKIGNPTWDEALKGYVYADDPPKDWSLTFTFRNESNSFSIDVPASDLLATAAAFNSPLSNRIENNQTFLRLVPTPFGDEMGAYIGRAIAKYLYVVDDATLEKFHLSAVNVTAAKNKDRNIISGSYMLLVDDVRAELKTDKNIGAILGGTLGGVAILVIAAGAWAFVMHRRRSAEEPGKSTMGRSTVGASKVRSYSPRPPGNLEDPEKFAGGRHGSASAAAGGGGAGIGLDSFYSNKALEAAFPLPPNSAPSSATTETFQSATGLSARPSLHQMSPVSPLSPAISPSGPGIPSTAISPTSGIGTWPRRASRHELELESPHYYKPHPPPPPQHIARLISVGSLRNTSSTQSLPATVEKEEDVRASRGVIREVSVRESRRASEIQIPPSNGNGSEGRSRRSNPSLNNLNASASNSIVPTPDPNTHPFSYPFPIPPTSSSSPPPPPPANLKPTLSRNSLQRLNTASSSDSRDDGLSRTASIARVVSPREIALSPNNSIRRKSEHGLLSRESSRVKMAGHGGGGSAVTPTGSGTELGTASLGRQDSTHRRARSDGFHILSSGSGTLSQEREAEANYHHQQQQHIIHQYRPTSPLSRSPPSTPPQQAKRKDSIASQILRPLPPLPQPAPQSEASQSMEELTKGMEMEEEYDHGGMKVEAGGSEGARTRGRPSSELEGWGGGVERR